MVSNNSRHLREWRVFAYTKSFHSKLHGWFLCLSKCMNRTAMHTILSLYSYLYLYSAKSQPQKKQNSAPSTCKFEILQIVQKSHLNRRCEWKKIRNPAIFTSFSKVSTNFHRYAHRHKNVTSEFFLLSLQFVQVLWVFHGIHLP